MGTLLRVLAALLVIGLVVGIGTAVYNTGVNAGMAASADVVAASGNPAVAPYAFGGYGPGYGYGPGPYWHGPGFFGIFFFFLGIILIIGVVRAAVGWGGGPRGPGGWGGRRERFEELHRDLHRGDSTGGERSPAS